MPNNEVLGVGEVALVLPAARFWILFRGFVLVFY